MLLFTVRPCWPFLLHRHRSLSQSGSLSMACRPTTLPKEALVMELQRFQTPFHALSTQRSILFAARILSERIEWVTWLPWRRTMVKILPPGSRSMRTMSFTGPTIRSSVAQKRSEKIKAIKPDGHFTPARMVVISCMPSWDVPIRLVIFTHFTRWWLSELSRSFLCKYLQQKQTRASEHLL